MKNLFVSFSIFAVTMVMVLAAFAQTPTGGSAISRPHDPVVLTGADLFPTSDPVIADLTFYAWDGADWTAVPFQVDEVTAAGTYTTTGRDDDDGGAALLDDNDEIVFMGYDAGQTNSCVESAQLASGDHDRQAITITDPLNNETGTMYVYDAGLAGSTDSYFGWDAANQTVSGSFNSNYEATFGTVVTPSHVALDALTANNSVDLLDRMKIRIAAQAQPQFFVCLAPVGLSLDENSAGDFLTSGIDLPVVGPIRAVGGGQDTFNIAAYGSRLEIGFAIDTASLEQGLIDSGTPICADSLQLNYARISFDGNDPAMTGMSDYFDSNGNVATIDGAPDAVSTAAVPQWFQLSDDGTNGGIVMAINTLDVGSGTAGTYYLDDATGGVTADPAPYNVFPDSGDNLSYSDVGLTITGSGNSAIAMGLTTYILEPNVTGNVGATYYDYAANPLTSAVAAESCALAPATPTITPTVTTNQIPLTVQTSVEHTAVTPSYLPALLVAVLATMLVGIVIVLGRR